jgi:hypothetical protein
MKIKKEKEEKERERLRKERVRRERKNININTAIDEKDESEDKTQIVASNEEKLIVIDEKDKLLSENQTPIGASNDMLVLFLFGLGDFEDFTIPCLSLQATEVLKKMRLIQPPFEDIIALQELVDKNFSREAVLEKLKTMIVFEYSSDVAWSG